MKKIYIIQYNDVISKEGYNDIADAFDRLDRQGYKNSKENNWTKIDSQGNVAKIFEINIK